jgi:uncharacterized protein (TIGR02246 family)
MNRTLMCALLGGVLLSACQKADKPADAAQIEAQLRQTEAEWNKAYAAHDAAAVANFYSDDAALANPLAPLATGKDAIARDNKTFAADPNMSVEFASDRVQVAASGDMAYTRGHYTMTMTDPETKKPVTGKGNYLTVWQKQKDGSWRAVEDFITPGPATAGDTNSL